MNCSSSGEFGAGRGCSQFVSVAKNCHTDLGRIGSWSGAGWVNGREGLLWDRYADLTMGFWGVFDSGFSGSDFFFGRGIRVDLVSSVGLRMSPVV
jgi:hypothetical protein